jgi:hypothetical protein
LQEKSEKLNQLNQENGRLKHELLLLKKETKVLNQDKENSQLRNDSTKKKRGKSRERRKKEKNMSLQKIFDKEEDEEDKDDDISKREITFYDIPARYSDTEVVAALRKIGKIRAISLKKQFKYQTVKAVMILDSLHERFFNREVMNVNLAIESENKEKRIQVCWFDGKMPVKDIKEKCQWKAYKILHNSYLRDVAKGNYEFEFGKNVYFNKKLVFLAFFKSEEDMMKARNKLIELEKNDKDRIWIIHGSGKRKTRRRIVDTQENGTPSPDETTTQSEIPKSTELKEIESVVKNKETHKEETKTIQRYVSSVPNEDHIVDMVNSFCASEIKEWMEQKEKEIELKEKEVEKKLKKDNVSTEKVVNIIQDLRKDLVKADTKKPETEAGPSKQRYVNYDNGIIDENYVPDSKEVIRARLEENIKRRQASREIGEEIRSLAQIE